MKKILGKNSSLTFDILNTEVHSNKECTTPCILDRDAVLAANFLTIEDSKDTLELMLNVFKGLRSDDCKYPLAKMCVMWSFTNFNWFVKFTEELIRLVLGDDEKFDFPMDLCPPIVNCGTKDQFGKAYFCPPLKYNTKKKRAELVKFRTKVIDPVDCYRIQYISCNYYLEDFREGYPAWYSLRDVVVYENYSPRTNKRIRIVHRNGEYHYYLTGASDNWKEIMEVPLEMDYVVSALLFRD